MSDIFGGPPDDYDDDVLYDPFGTPVDRFGNPLDWEEMVSGDTGNPDYWWHGEEPQSWFYDRVELQNDYGQTYDFTVAQWYEFTTRPEEAELLTGMTPLEIIHQLEGDYDGIWDDQSWEDWRDWYDSQ